jgi:hypothetical protein
VEEDVFYTFSRWMYTNRLNVAELAEEENDAELPTNRESYPDPSIIYLAMKGSVYDSSISLASPDDSR